MSDKKFNENQIKALISSLLYIGKKNNGTISVESLEEAAEIVAFSAGFNSFKELKKSLRQESVSLSNNINSTFNISKNHIVDRKELLLLNKKNNLSISEKKSLKDKINLPTYPLTDDTEMVKMINQKDSNLIVVGSIYDEINKCDILQHLNRENTIFVGDNKNFFDLAIEKIIKKNITHLHIVDNKSQNEWLNNDYSQVVNIDPLNEIYCSDYFDVLFGLDYTDFNGFDVLWSMIIKDYISSNNYSMSSKFLKYSLTLDFLILYFIDLKDKKNPLSNLLERYFKDLGIELKNYDNINYDSNIIEKHTDKILPIYSKVKIVDDLYNKGVFKVSKRESIINLLKNRKSVQLQFSETNDDYLMHIKDTLVNYLLNTYENVCEKNNYKKENYQLTILVDFKNLINKKHFYKNQYSYIIKYLPDVNESLNYVEQIVFGKQNDILKFDNNFLVNIYTNTENLINIFAFKNKKLSDLKINESYLWKKDLENKYLDVFKINLISLSKVQIIQKK